LELRLADFPAGKQVDAFVSPAYPAKSVLEPPAAPRWNLLAIGIAITVMCGILLLR
jgi:hypothetical protein